jgi:hypothetical protein
MINQNILATPLIGFFSLVPIQLKDNQSYCNENMNKICQTTQ